MLSTSNLDSLEAITSVDASNVNEVEAPAVTTQKPSVRQELQIFTSTFLTVLLAELGDKTQVATLLISAQSQSPWVVFVGGGMALIATSLLGVLLGRWLAKRVSAKTLETSTGVLLLLISALMLCDLIQ